MCGLADREGVTLVSRRVSKASCVATRVETMLHAQMAAWRTYTVEVDIYTTTNTHHPRVITRTAHTHARHATISRSRGTLPKGEPAHMLLKASCVWMLCLFVYYI